MKRLQHGVFQIMREEEDKSLPGEIFDWVMIVLIVANLVFLILDTFTLPGWYKPLGYWVETVSTIVFTLEYLLRLWIAPLYYPDRRPAKSRMKYIFSFIAVVDFLSVMPFYLPFVLPVNLRVLRVFRLIRLLRLIKVSRYTEAFNALTRVFKKKADQLAISLGVLFLLILIAAILMYDIEHDAQPEVFRNAASGLWWALDTVTSVGDGSITPITPLGRFLGALIGLMGVAMVAVPTGIISAGFVSLMGEDAQPPVSAAEEIAKYKKLLDENAITPDEYAEKKKQLLAGK